jgi:single-strand DNA-binding protein
MPASLNKVLLIGNLTRDPELRYIPSGQAVTSFTIAVNRTYLDQNNEKKEEASFIRVVTWGKRAEVCNEYLKKGSSVFVEGRLQSRSWEAQDGAKRTTIEVVAQNIQFLSKANKGPTSAPAETTNETIIEDDFSESSKKTKTSGASEELAPDEEVPF